MQKEEQPMSDHGTVRPSIAREFHSAVVGLLPDLNDDQMQRLIRGKGILRKALREAVSSVIEEIGRLFTITHDGRRSVTELVRIGSFTVCKRYFTDEFFPIEPHEPVTRTIVLVEIDDDHIIPEQVLYEFEQRGLSRPTYEDALYFGIEYLKGLVGQDIVFLHEPVEVTDPYNGRARPMVIKLSSRLQLDLEDLRRDTVWLRRTVFAAVAESL